MMAMKKQETKTPKPVNSNTAARQSDMAARKCIVTRETLEHTDMIRFVCGPGAVVCPDIRKKLPGRGVWVTCRRGQVETAMRKNLFARGLKTRCTVPDDLANLVDRQLEERCLSMLSLARKSGQLLTGFDKISAKLATCNPAILIQARDGSLDGQKKLEGKFRAQNRQGQVIKLFTSQQMALALGGTNVIHAVLTHGTMLQSLSEALYKLRKYRGLDESDR